MELLAEGRTAEVFADGDGRVLKLDRPDWNGLSALRSVRADPAGRCRPPRRPAARHAHGGRALRRDPRPGRRSVTAAGADRRRPGGDRPPGGRSSSALQLRCNETLVAGLARAGAAPASASSRRVYPTPAQRAELLTLAGRAGRRGRAGSATSTSIPPTCWSAPTAGSSSTGSPWPRGRRRPTWPAPWCCGDSGRAGSSGRFLRAVRSEGRARRGLADDALDDWIRIVAAARVTEGFDGEEKAWLQRVAGGSERLFV